MVSELIEQVANYQGKGYVIAPAGYGKTYSICEATKYSEGKQLILTHTYAGVSTIQKRMKELEVHPNKYQVNTIAGWSLSLCLSYPQTSGFTSEKPNNEEWNPLYEATTNLVSKNFISEILKCSYSGIFIDEYQDCSLIQHNLILALSELLPCRIFGDPMQAIFDFNEPTVNWEEHVVPNFSEIGRLETPWRWENDGNTELAEWLVLVREKLINGEIIDLADRPSCVDLKSVTNDTISRKQQNTCRHYQINNGETAIAIHTGHMNNGCHSIARHVSGKFCSLEEIEGGDVFHFIEAFEATSEISERVKMFIKFLADKCFTNVNAQFSTPSKRGEINNNPDRAKNPNLTIAVNNYINSKSSSDVLNIIEELASIDEVKVVRRDLLNRVKTIFRRHASAQNSTLVEEANRYHVEFRNYGRPVKFPKIISTTLLVKGLQYDHAIILDATGLSQKELYVALTRGIKKLTIISKSSVLNRT